MEAKAFNQILKANAKISVFQINGILGESSGYCNGTIHNLYDSKCATAYTTYNPYKNGYSEAHINGKELRGNYLGLTFFGYKSEEDAQNANIKVTYTPAYGGSIAIDFFNDKGQWGIGKGDNKQPFDEKLYGVVDNNLHIDNLSWIRQKINNGIYKFEDLNNKYIKPTYLHLMNP
ncbi:hypothetical protein IO405_001296 [Campylobacter lari]|nr:hypothetical protein [Campylobacter lari]